MVTEESVEFPARTLVKVLNVVLIWGMGIRFEGWASPRDKRARAFKAEVEEEGLKLYGAA